MALMASAEDITPKMQDLDVAMTIMLQVTKWKCEIEVARKRQEAWQEAGKRALQLILTTLAPLHRGVGTRGSKIQADQQGPGPHKVA